MTTTPTPDDHPKKGEVFTHTRFLDLNWKPQPGQKWSTDAPYAQCVVSSVRRGRVYYRYVGDAPDSGTFNDDLTTFLRTYPADARHMPEPTQPTL